MTCGGRWYFKNSSPLFIKSIIYRVTPIRWSRPTNPMKVSWSPCLRTVLRILWAMDFSRVTKEGICSSPRSWMGRRGKLVTFERFRKDAHWEQPYLKLSASHCVVSNRVRNFSSFFNYYLWMSLIVFTKAVLSSEGVKSQKTKDASSKFFWCFSMW